MISEILSVIILSSIVIFLFSTVCHAAVVFLGGGISNANADLGWSWKYSLGFHKESFNRRYLSKKMGLVAVVFLRLRNVFFIIFFVFTLVDYFLRMTF